MFCQINHAICPAWLNSVMSANTAINGSDFPVNGSARHKLAHAMKCASLTVATNDWRPWQFRLADQYVELSATPNPMSDTADSDDREMMIRCGAALFHLKLALKRYGCLGRVELFPDLAEASLVARIHCGTSTPGGAQDVALFETMARKRNKSSFWSEPPVSESVFETIQSAATGEKAWLEFSRCDASRDQLVALAESSAKMPAQAGYRVAQPEPSRVAQWTRPLLTFVVGAGDAKKFTVEPGQKRASEMATLAVIKTKTDDKHGWLATGEAMARVRLLARASEISSQVFNQAFQSRRLREVLRMSIGRKGFVQAIIGFGSQPAHWTAAASEQTVAGHMFEPDTDYASRIHRD